MFAKPGAVSPHKAYFYYRGNNLEAVRKGRWKLRHSKKNVELYNIKADISEKRNLADHMPEKVTQLTNLMKEFDSELKANTRPAGKVS